ncbi:DUF559 domain-containing protein [Desulfobacterales bacterium HSG2]|nr:DUF559 domain-containing protein [Desulfobacterales bacterium HSG2]
MAKGHLVTYQWNRLPSQSDLIDNLLDILAQAALGMWPLWYNNDQLFKLTKQGNTDKIISNFLAASDIAKIRLHVSKSWLKEAIRCCHSGMPPRLKGFPVTVQIRQLALAIDPDRLVIVLGINDHNPPKARMLGLAKASDWIATTANAGIAVFLPELLANKKELESILYEAIHLRPSQAKRDSEVKEEENKLLIAPVKGQPHPFSPGEKALYERLAKDEELSGLFAFNQTVRTKRQNAYLVDIVWMEGKVVVEVDGYRYHSDQYAFRYDRHRDYELLITGYHVLRLPHDLVMEDVDREIEKIRDVVRFRKRKKEEK